jgi:hypothetical protein
MLLPMMLLTLLLGLNSPQFRNYHIPAGLMKIKKKVFLSLKQGNMSISEYHDEFIQLSRYAPDEVADDEKSKSISQKDSMGHYSMHWLLIHFHHFRGYLIKL